MATEFTKECDINQGYNFRQNNHQMFGYITSFVLGDNNISPDIKVVEPSTISSVTGSGNAGTTGPGGTFDSSGIFKKPVVSVLTNVAWSTLPTDNIKLQGRISVANAQQLNMLIMQSLKKVVISLSFEVYEYDLVNQVYFTGIKSYKGVSPGPAPVKAGGPGFGAETDAAQVFALLGKTSGTEFGIRVGAKAEEDIPGIKNHTLELALAPPIASSPQQILIQTSSKIKLIQPWGIPQR